MNDNDNNNDNNTTTTNNNNNHNNDKCNTKNDNNDNNNILKIIRRSRAGLPWPGLAGRSAAFCVSMCLFVCCSFSL